MKRHDQLIAYIMQHRRCNQNEANDWANEHLGSDWRSRKTTKTKRIIVKELTESETDND
ncbi:hypothetical protein [Shewanella sp. NIFS-20-20]|uniref:hypothetical protein n=1 Tax=Shewanella sp. NIFS-20-20 TaxID=2853806 RepID=UPI001C4420B3|nr:hypothetical protein [Shewanella sp. NIFS-20-20]MBV7315474.1 hypothetical protein [Shewanella sp. NIFS-20-20]